VSGADFSDFTEAGYRRAIRLAKRRYAFERFGTRSTGPHVLWRHDVDASAHRAARLAEIEAEEGVTATYLFWLHSPFYNLLERSVLDAVRSILDRGHALGLHFESSFYGRIGSVAELADCLATEAALLAELAGADVEVFSFHNPGVPNDDLVFDDDRVAGLVNAYGRTVRERYEYVSDSNGHWRFRRLYDVLEEPGPERLHVLTHPEWWQQAPMPPRQRLVRCVEGRAQHVLRVYDELLAAAGRENIG